MQLKALDIHGFKSFPDRIQLTFDQGITAVVGPNGSGKSNIADAVRWVLGEQSGKTLRSGKMEDVIFSGTQQRGAMGYSSVALTIDNRDRDLDIECDEVVVNRKLYRSGESEYRINGASVRLRDINELFMDTGLGRDGYSIIGQGRIAEIVSAKSAQRREIFEEAAGISKYRYRREQAERRLEGAQENLLRLRDILLELEGRVGPLREQSKKASEYLELAERKRALEISLWLLGLSRSKEQLRVEDDKLLLTQTENEALREQLAAAEVKIATCYEEIATANIQLEATRGEQDTANGQIAEKNARIAVLQNDISHNAETAARLEQDISLRAGSRVELEESIEGAKTQIAEKSAQREALDASLGGLQGELLALEHQRGELLTKQNALTQEKAEVAHRIASERLSMATSSTLLEQAAQTAKTLEDNKAQQQQALLDLTGQYKNYTELCWQIDEQLEGHQNVKKGYLIKHKSVSDRIEEQNGRYTELLSRQKGYLQKAKLIEDMERSMEGFGHSVRFIMNQSKQGALRGIEGTVSQLIRVKSEHAVAIEVALAGALQNIVVQNDTAAKVAIEVLKKQKAGRATFLPISVIKGRTLTESGLAAKEGFVAVACDLVDTEEKYREIVSNLLGRIVVVSDLDAATALAKAYQYRFKIVTLDGQVVNPGGSLTGGSLSQSTGLLSRAGEIESLRAKAQETQEQLDALAAEKKNSTEELSRLSAQLLGLDAEIKNAGEDKIRYEGEQKRVRMSRDQLEEAIEEAQRQREQVAKKLEELYAQSGSSEEAIASMEAVEAKLSEAYATTTEALSAISETLTEATQCRSLRDMERLSLVKDVEALEGLVEQLCRQQSEQQGQSQEMQARIGALYQKNEEIQGEIAAEQQFLLQQEKSIAALLERMKALGERKLQLEQQATDSRTAERELHARAETMARDLARLEERKITLQTEYDSLIARLYDEYELTLTEAQSLATPLEDPQGAARELGILKNRIKALGNINVAAIEEYREVSERYTYLKSQIEDVEKSKEELYRLISELTGEMKELFQDSFTQINNHFGKIFVELFLGGNARLILTEPDNVLESGIEIYVQPPGKIIKNLAALSGGEQAFVAIAIYFAILKVRPSPFCLLDEIEAALDDVNVVRYAAYLRRLTGSTQFITITHRRGTMEEADVLYGVTMQEEGVSKLLRLGVSELEQKLGMK